MKGIGLVFSGGGGKGAYEIGVWKYLHENGLDNYVKSISGTSVGALNAALFVGSNIEKAEDMWVNIAPSKIFSPKKYSAKDIENWLIENDLDISNLTTKIMSKTAAASIWPVKTISELLLLKFNNDHFFTREGLSEMIEESINYNALQSSDIPCFSTCVKLPLFRIERFKLNDYLPDEILTILLASSAMPLIFPKEEFKGKKYYDGGLPLGGDNTPIRPVYDTDVENIIVVHLNRETLIDKSEFPNSNIIEIVPSVDLGNVIKGTLDFTPEGAKRRIEIGYNDAKKVFQPMIEMLFMYFENQKNLADLKKAMAQFDKERRELLQREAELKNKMANDGFDDLHSKIIRRNKNDRIIK